jgi:hypothetical protein
MIHCIHLEDHQDIGGDPFQFLDIPEDQFTPTLQSSRGGGYAAVNGVNFLRSWKVRILISSIVTHDLINHHQR